MGTTLIFLFFWEFSFRKGNCCINAWEILHFFNVSRELPIITEDVTDTSRRAHIHTGTGTFIEMGTQL